MMTVDECVKYVEDHLIVKYATSNGAYISGRTITPNGCVNHSLGVAQPSVDAIFNNMNQAGAGWGVNAILGDFHKGEGKIILALKMNSRPWGCGSGSKGSYNNTRIQWEVCEPAGHTYSGGTMIGYNVKKNQAYFDRMWKMLVAWNVYCIKKLGYSASDICDHSESYKAGYGTNHADMMHWLPKHGKSMDALRSEVKSIINGTTPAPTPKKGIQAIDFQPMTEAEVVKIVGPLCTEDEKKTGILACITMAQFILESGYGRVSEAAKYANNCFGMKSSLSNNSWSGSTWDGKSVYKMETQEWKNGNYITIIDTFRKYPCIEDSIGDHSAYLLGAMNGAAYRYEGLKGCKDYKKAIKIIKNGGYATDPIYVDKIINIIERWNLTQYNYNGKPAPSPESEPVDPGRTYPDTPFEVRALVSLPIFMSIESKEKSGIKTGPGVFTIVETSGNYGLLKSYKEKRNGWIKISNSQKCEILDTVKDDSFKVKVDISGLRIRKGPGTNEEFIGTYTGVGIFTIVDIQKGPGSKSGWGLLKSYKEKRNGWVSLDYATRIQG